MKSNHRKAFGRTLGVAIASLFAITSCKDSPSAPVPVLSSINVTLPASTLVAGNTTTATAAGVDQFGASIATGTVTWSTSAAAVATVNPTSGVVTGVAAGTAQVIASAGGKTGQQTITVSPAPAVLTTINATITPASITFGQTVTATVAGVDQYGAAMAPGAVVWSSATPAVATVDAGTGVVTGVTAGTSQITATAGAKTSQKVVTVTAPPAIKVNEVESNGGTPGDWIELYNTTNAAVDLSNFSVRDNDVTHSYKLPAGTTIAANGYLMVEEAALGFGLGAADDARLYNPFGALVDMYTWTAHAAITYGRCPNGTGDFAANTASTKNAANDCRPAIRVNEVESNGGTPGDWIELYNAGATAVNVGGFVVKDNDDTHNTVIAAGTTIAPGAFLVIEEATLGYGLGAADAARLFDPNGVLVDSYTWTVHAGLTYGRCPDGSGDFASTTASTKSAANVCTPVGPAAWPGSDDAHTIDGTTVFGGNLSGLTYEGASGGNPNVLWAVRNGPGTLYRLIFSGGIWTPDPANDWGIGKALRYTDNLGNTDAEGVTFAAGGSAGGIYVATERNNDASTISRNSVLRFDPAQAGATLRATHDWNLTADLPVVGANLGIEAITWIPDSMLVANKFFDETKAHLYAPAEYADHGTGLFFVGVEGNGNIYVYALNHANSTYSRIATIVTGFPGVMGMEYDRESGYLWATCDDGCNNTAGVLEIDTGVGSPTLGRFRAPRQFARPPSLPNLNNEGFAFAPNSQCVANRKPVFWADDSETGGHSIRTATIACGTIPASVIQGIQAALWRRP